MTLATAVALRTPLVLANETVVHFSVPKGEATSTLLEFGREAELSVVFNYDDVHGIETRSISGNLPPRRALKKLLRNTQLTFEFTDDTTVVVRTHRSSGTEGLSDEGSAKEVSPESLAMVTVTGSHMRGIPLIGVETNTVSQKQLSDQSIRRPEDLVRAVPQFFGGGPSEDTSLGREAPTNFERGTGLNIRGLGAGDTLLLLDGLRLPLGGSAGSWFDMANIPLAACERVDIVPYDTSARYGSYAIGGLVNFVLKQNFRGVQIEGLVGEAAGQTLRERQFDLLAGNTWVT
jgi:iron complex outermembrane receptor protein